MIKVQNFIRNILIAIFFLTAISHASGQSIERITKAYINKYKEIAIKDMRIYKIPASITLAQAVLESGSGKGKLARRANNHFGIKCHKGWTGKTFRMTDNSWHECFRKYRNPKDSYQDHSMFLTHEKRYAFLFKYPITDYKKWAYGLKRAGYATNPRYPQLLIGIIQRYQLYQYDHAPQKKSRRNERYTEPYTEPSIKSFTLGGKNVNNRPYYLNNGKKLIIVRAGDTFDKLAFDFELSRRKLLRDNEVNKNYILHPGEIIYLQKKAARAEKMYRYHVVKQGENLWQISQIYGVRLSKIRSLNNLPKRYQPPVGTRLKMR